MCKYCEGGKPILSKQINVDQPFYNTTVTYEKDYIVMIDRGFLRLADADDCQCLDHGEKIKITYCCMCGRKITLDKT